MADQANILGHVSFKEHDIGEKYDVSDVKKNFGSIEAWGTYPAYNRVKVVKRENGRGKAIRVKYPEGKVRFLESGASWHWKNFGEHRDLYLSYWVKFSKVFVFMAGGKMHGFCGGACNTGGDKPNGHDGWSSRVHWGENGTIKQYVYHKDQPGKYGDVFFWSHNPETIIVGDGETLNQNVKQNVYLKRGQWHFIVTRVAVNDIGEENGFIQSWLDGEPVLDVYGFEFRDKSVKKEDLLIDKMYFCTFFGGRTDDFKPVKDEYADFTDFRISKGLYCPPKIKCQRIEPKIALKNPQPMLFDANVPNRAGKYGYGIRLEWIVPPDVKPAFYEIQFTTGDKIAAGKWITYQAKRQASHGAWINHHGDIKFNKYIRCLESGKIYFYRMRAYDASANLITAWSNIVSGTTLAYLKLSIKKAEPKLFTGEVPNKSGKYGFGMRIEWLASVHPATAFYEIQYTTKENLKKEIWEILSRDRPKKYDWINHFGQEIFGSYIRCLPCDQQYWYRVRPLNKEKRPLADWANIISGVMTDYSRVTITKVESQLFEQLVPGGGGKKYGYGMRIEWERSLHPDSYYYEIRFTENPRLDVANWEVLDTRISVLHKDWINHHGKTVFINEEEGADDDENIQYSCCLPANKTFYYRVRTLDKAGNPLDEWSHTRYGKVKNYTKGRKRKVPDNKV